MAKRNSEDFSEDSGEHGEHSGGHKGDEQRLEREIRQINLKFRDIYQGKDRELNNSN